MVHNRQRKCSVPTHAAVYFPKCQEIALTMVTAFIMLYRKEKQDKGIRLDIVKGEAWVFN